MPGSANTHEDGEIFGYPSQIQDGQQEYVSRAVAPFAQAIRRTGDHLSIEPDGKPSLSRILDPKRTSWEVRECPRRRSGVPAQSFCFSLADCSDKAQCCDTECQDTAYRVALSVIWRHNNIHVRATHSYRAKAKDSQAQLLSMQTKEPNKLHVYRTETFCRYP